MILMSMTPALWPDSTDVGLKGNANFVILMEQYTVKKKVSDIPVRSHLSLGGNNQIIPALGEFGK
jgi:hypothetical protein